MKKTDVFTAYEGYSIMTVAFLFHVFSGSLPELANSCGPATWIALTVGMLLSGGLFSLYYLLVKLHPGKNLPEMLESALGKPMAKLCMLYLTAYFFLYTANNLGEATTILVENTYSHTRNIMLAIAFLMIAWVVALYPVRGLARTASIAVPLFFASIATILLLSWNQYDLTYLTPILGYGLPTILQKGFFHMTNFDGFLIILFFVTSYGSAASFRKCSLWSLLTTNLSFILSAFCFAISGPYQTVFRNRAGLLDLAQAIYINRFFQRFDSIFILFVCMGKLLVICVGTMALKKAFCSLFEIPDKYASTVVLPLLLTVLAFNQMSLNLPLFGEMVRTFMRQGSLFFTLGLVTLLLAGTWLRRAGGKGRKTALRTACLLLACCLSGSLLGGCNQVSEPDEEVFAVIMGYDRSSTETLRITVKLMPEDKASAGGGDGGAFTDQEGTGGIGHIPDNIFTVDAPCNIPAVDLISTVLPKHMSLLHVKMLVISEDLAREDLDMLITPIVRYNEIKSTIAVVICEGSASEYISSKSSDLIPFLPLETEMILKQNKGSASYLVRTMGDIFQQYSSNYGDAVVMYGGLTRGGQLKMNEEFKSLNEAAMDQKDGGEEKDSNTGQESGGTQSVDPDGTFHDLSPTDPFDPQNRADTFQEPSAAGESSETPRVYYDDPEVGYINGYLPGEIPIETSVENQIAGMAVLKDARMVGTLNTHEAKMFMMADGSFSGAVVVVRDPYEPDLYVICYGETRQKSRVKTNIDESGVANIDMEVFVRADLAIVQNTTPDYEEVHEKERLRLYMQEYLEQEIEHMVEKLQKEYDSDALRLGRYVSHNFLTIDEWEEYNWPERYRDANINVTLNLKL